jgi:DNA-binding MarR family transcriptional regulator
MADSDWSDDFPVDGIPEGWDTYAYHRGDANGSGPLVSLNDDKYQTQVRNGTLMSPFYNISDEGNFLAIRSEVYHNSTQAEGCRWSFDWIVSGEPGRSHGAIDHFLFSFSSESDNWNATGMSDYDFFVADKRGFMLTLVSRPTEDHGFNRSIEEVIWPTIDSPIIMLTVFEGMFWDPPKIPYLIGGYEFEENIEGTHQIDILRDDDYGEVTVYYDKQLIIEYGGYGLIAVDTSEKIGYISVLGDSGIDNLELKGTPDLSENTENLDAGWILLGGSLGVISVFSTWKIGKTKVPKLLKNRRVKRSKQILQTFSEIFTEKQLMYVAVLGQSKPTDTDWEKQVPKKYRSGLIQYRYLMHPIRLSIMKLLYKNFTLTSQEIKKQLDLSWGDYSNHINSLAKKQFVAIQTEFHDTDQRQVVYLEELGRQEYKALIDLLKEFLKNAEHENAEHDLEFSDLLYPEDSRD